MLRKTDRDKLPSPPSRCKVPARGQGGTDQVLGTGCGKSDGCGARAWLECRGLGTLRWWLLQQLVGDQVSGICLPSLRSGEMLPGQDESQDEGLSQQGRAQGAGAAASSRTRRMVQRKGSAPPSQPPFASGHSQDFSPPWMAPVQRQHGPDLHAQPGET